MMPTIVAHRGLHSAAVPENSVAAFAAAWAAGVAWAECDVYVLADGGVFVLHDDTLDRTTDGTGPVMDQPSDRVAACRLRDAAGRLTDQTVPRLRDVVAAMSPDDRLLVEVKETAGPWFVDALMGELADRPVTLQSFDPKVLRIARALAPHLPLAFLVETPEMLAAATKAKHPAVHARHDLLDERTVRRLRTAGKRVGAWTVNAPADLHRLLALGVDTVITDDPLAVARASRP